MGSDSEVSPRNIQQNQQERCIHRVKWAISSPNKTHRRYPMNAEQILKKIIQQVTPKMHQYRRKALIACVDSLMNGHALTVTQLGRGINGSAKEKHRTKRADRLLSNPHFRQSHLSIYASAAALFVSHLPRPLISIDWSDIAKRGRIYLLINHLDFYS